MKSFIPPHWLAVVLVVGCAGGATRTLDISAIGLRVIAESSGLPLANRELQVFEGYEDVVFEFAKSKASEQKHYLRTVVTDTNGCFTLDLSDPKMPQDIIIQPGPPYDIVHIEMASDIAHTKSAFHVRVVRFVKGTHQVERNDIYDLRQQTVRQISLKGKEAITPFQEVLLVAREIRTPAQATGAAGGPVAQP